MSSLYVRVRFVAALLALLIGLSAVGSAAAAPPPEGFGKYLVYFMNGVVNPDDPSFVPDGGDVFQREIMQRTTEEIAAEYARAEQFFLERFGVDFAAVEAVDGVKTVGNMTMDTRGFMLDPEREYRAYTISGMTVPDEGWLVRDGGWLVAVGELQLGRRAVAPGEWVRPPDAETVGCVTAQRTRPCMGGSGSVFLF